MLFKDLNYGCFFTVNSEGFPPQKNCFIKVSPFTGSIELKSGLFSMLCQTGAKVIKVGD